MAETISCWGEPYFENYRQYQCGGVLKTEKGLTVIELEDSSCGDFGNRYIMKAELPSGLVYACQWGTMRCDAGNDYAFKDCTFLAISNMLGVNLWGVVHDLFMVGYDLAVLEDNRRNEENDNPRKD